MVRTLVPLPQIFMLVLVSPVRCAIFSSISWSCLLLSSSPAEHSMATGTGGCVSRSGSGHCGGWRLRTPIGASVRWFCPPFWAVISM